MDIFSIDDEILLVIDAVTQGESEEFQEAIAHIGDYAGQTVTLRITLRGSGAADSHVDIDNLRFTKLTIKADINEDGLVNLKDYANLAQYWTCLDCNDISDCSVADLDDNGIIGLGDLVLLTENWLWQKLKAVKEGDFDGNGEVDLADLAIFSSYWLSDDCNLPDWCRGTDLNFSHVVNFIDWARFTEYWRIYNK